MLDKVKMRVLGKRVWRAILGIGGVLGGENGFWKRLGDSWRCGGDCGGEQGWADGKIGGAVGRRGA